VYGHARETSPFLESFAASGTLFERAYSTSSWTLPAHGSLFTGSHPKVHGANQRSKRVSESLPLLSEELRALGYQTAAFSGNTWVSERSGLDRGFEYFAPLYKGYLRHVQALARQRREVPISAEEHGTVRALRSWTEEDRDPERPWFVFVNLVDAHLPYLPPWGAVDDLLESNAERVAAIERLYPKGTGGHLLHRHYRRAEPLDEWEWALLRSMYEGVLRVTDALTEAIVATLDGASPQEETLIFVLSDHGENLGDHEHLTHIFNLYDSNLRILLLARGPGFSPGTVRPELVQILDLYPTILRAAGGEPGPQAIGVDLRGALPTERILHATLEYPQVSLRNFPEDVRASGRLGPYERELNAAIGPRYKLIRGSDGREERFDLQSDPGDVLQRLRAAIETAAAFTPPVPGAEHSEWDTEEGLRELREMGYVE